MLRLDLVVGPNGAGKSTFVRYTLAPLIPGSVFVNADEIAMRRWPEAAEAHAYEAAEAAADTREALMRDRRPFIAETVFSHPSKLDLLTRSREAGFTAALHVVMVPEELAVRRVAERVRAGGHSVPEHKIRARYRRLWPLVAEAITAADMATVYDNSAHGGPGIVAQFSQGVATGVAPWPVWAPPELSGRWPE